MFDYYEPCLFGEGERSLFYRLPLEDRSMGYGEIGHLRGELYRCGFRSFWIADAPHLITPAFRRELKSLRSALGLGLLNGSNMSLDFCGTAPTVGGQDTGFKICTENYSYYFRCTPTAEGYDITMFAYDNSFLLPELAGLHKLPDHCFSILPDSGELVALQQERPTIQSFHSDDPIEVRRRIADDLNEAMGVTKAQEKAMLGGCLHGFDQPCAWPWQYDQNGEPRDYDKPKHRDKEVR